MKRYTVLDKKVGETPLQCLEKHRIENPTLYGVSMAYAGRLDPMASGKLLVLIGDECKVQEKYHNLDKEYEFEVLFGVSSDTGDVLGLLTTCEVSCIEKWTLTQTIQKFIGDIQLPYPHFSSKTVKGKPLHVWKLEGKIDTVEIPTKLSTIFNLKLIELKKVTAQEAYVYATQKIETISKVTETSKALGNDFRRSDIRLSWKKFINEDKSEQELYVAKFACIASSGTYMRTLAEMIAKELNTCGLAYSIHRTKIGKYKRIFPGFGFWTKMF